MRPELNIPHMSPISFLRPAILLHVYHRWREGTHEEITSRSFATAQGDEPFKMFGAALALKFITDWHIPTGDLGILRSLPTLQNLEDGFWDYLSQVRVKGNIEVIPEGIQIGGIPIEASESIRKLQGDHPPFPLMNIEDAAGFVAMITEGTYAILECAILHSRLIAREQLRVGDPMFFHAEREDHPLWSTIKLMTETGLGARTPLERKSTLDIWLWWDTRRRNGEPTPSFMRDFQGLQTAYKNETGGELNMLIEKVK